MKKISFADKITFIVITINLFAIIFVVFYRPAQRNKQEAVRDKLISTLQAEADTLSSNQTRVVIVTTNLLHKMWVVGFRDGSKFILSILPSAMHDHNLGTNDADLSAALELKIKKRIELGEFYEGIITNRP